MSGDRIRAYADYTLCAEITICHIAELTGCTWTASGTAIWLYKLEDHGSAHFHRRLPVHMIPATGPGAQHALKQGAILYWEGVKYLFAGQEAYRYAELYSDQNHQCKSIGSYVTRHQVINPWILWIASQYD